jgi:hypothetical protein
MRIPTSCVRCETEYESTPYTPVTASTSASAAKIENRIALNRRVELSRANTSSKVAISAIGTSLSTACTARLTVAVNACMSLVEDRIRSIGLGCGIRPDGV